MNRLKKGLVPDVDASFGKIRYIGGERINEERRTVNGRFMVVPVSRSINVVFEKGKHRNVELEFKYRKGDERLRLFDFEQEVKLVDVSMGVVSERYGRGVSALAWEMKVGDILSV